MLCTSLLIANYSPILGELKNVILTTAIARSSLPTGLKIGHLSLVEY
jgi:hypothetical protein